MNIKVYEGKTQGRRKYKNKLKVFKILQHFCGSVALIL